MKRPSVPRPKWLVDGVLTCFRYVDIADDRPIHKISYTLQIGEIESRLEYLVLNAQVDFEWRIFSSAISNNIEGGVFNTAPNLKTIFTLALFFPNSMSET